MKRTLALVLMLGILLGTCTTALAIETYKAELQQSRIMVAVPDNWNKNLLILAHGYRPEDAPLYADFSVDESYFKTLLDAGWLIASTSYRKNGLIIDEAVDDLNLLREYIIKKYGRPDMIFVDGRSMGGSIGIILSERYHDKYDGILSIDPAIKEWLHVNYKPLVPIIFLCNRDEAPPVRDYLEKVNKDAVKPGLWIVRRDGHVNVNNDEELAALKAVVEYSHNRPVEMSKTFIIDYRYRPSGAIFNGSSASAKVMAINPEWGNIDTGFVYPDLEKLGISKGARFTVQFKEKRFKVMMAGTYDDVPKGEWVAFLTPEGFLRIARNLDSAVKLLGCKPGDNILIRK